MWMFGVAMHLSVHLEYSTLTKQGYANILDLGETVSQID